MKLDYVTLAQFGGHRGLKVAFDDELTVVIGANDVGKSTIYQAIYHALFTPTTQHKRAFEQSLAALVPIDGGDHATVELGFSLAGESYMVEKTWSAKKTLRSSLLRHPSGTEVRDDEGIATFIAEHLPAAPKTVSGVLMSYQAGLGESLNELEGSETLAGLEDILRRAVMQVGGVSVPRFRDRVNDELEAVAGRWDFQTDGPERGRDFRNPWKVGVGTLLAASYDHERLHDHLSAVRATETELDESNRQLAQIEEQLRASRVWLEKNQEIFDALESRGRIQAELGAATERGARAKSVYDGWIRAASEFDDARERIPVLEKQVTDLTEKVASLELAEEHEVLRGRLQKADKGASRYQIAKTKLAGLRQMTADRLAELEDLDSELKDLRAVSRGALALTFRAHKDQQLQLTCDLDEPAEKTIFANRDLAIDASGRITLDHADWSLTVTTGEGDFAEQARRFDAARALWHERTTEFGITDLRAARTAAREFADASAALARAHGDLRETLGDEDIDSLRATVASLPTVGDRHDPQTVYRSHAEAVANLKTLRNTVSRSEAQIGTFEKSYAEPDLALEALAEAKAQAKVAKTDLSALPTLPEGIDSANFARDYRQRRDGVGNLQDRRGQAREDRATLAASLGDESTIELARRVEAALRTYERQQRRAKALLRVRDAAESILNGPSDDIYGGLRQHVERLVTRLTGARYGAATMNDALPEDLTRHDGVPIPIERLSQGMRDIVGLSVRLAIASHFLNGPGGFFIMDDPLVNLDATRQSEAVALLREVAAERQVVIFTCHDRHAELLNGSMVHI